MITKSTLLYSIHLRLEQVVAELENTENVKEFVQIQIERGMLSSIYEFLDPDKKIKKFNVKYIPEDDFDSFWKGKVLPSIKNILENKQNSFAYQQTIKWIDSKIEKQ